MRLSEMMVKKTRTGRHSMIAKNVWTVLAALTSVVMFGASSLATNISVTDTGPKIGRYWQREGCVAPHDAPEDNRYGDMRGSADLMTDEGETATAEFIGSMPSVGEPVFLHQIAGQVPRSGEWTGVPNFGRYRFLNWMPMVSLGALSATSAGPGQRDYLHLLFSGYAKVVDYKQSSEPSEYLPAKDEAGHVTSELVPADSKIAFSGGDYGLDECVLEYPDGRRWYFEFFELDSDRSPQPVNSVTAARKYHLVKYVDRHGYEVNITYSSSELKITDASNNEYVCTLGDAGMIKKIKIGDRSWDYAYTSDTVTETNNQTGRTTAVTTTVDGKKLISITKTGTDGKKNEKIYSYDTNGNLSNLRVNGVDISVVETNGTESIDGAELGYPAGTSWTMDVRTRVQTKDGKTVTYKYTNFGKVSETDGLNHEAKFPRMRTQHVIKQVDRNGNVTKIDYDDNGFRTKETFADGSGVSYEISYAYDENYNLITKTTPDGVWHYEYDGQAEGYTEATSVEDGAHNLLTRAYFTAGGQTLADTTYDRYEWDGDSQGLVKCTKELVGDGRTRSTAFEYNAKGQLTKKKGPAYGTTEPTTPVWQYEYDSYGNQTSVKDPLNHGVSSTYDYAKGDMLKTVKDALNNTTTYDYDGLGRRTKMTDATGAYVEWVYDGRGYVTRVTGTAAGSAKLGSYSVADSGLLGSYTDQNGHTWSYGYDDAGRKTSETDPTAYVTSYSYDNNGNLKTVTIPTSPAASTTTNDYDELNRVTDVTNGENETTHYEYDWAGRQTFVETADGANTQTFYDELGRVNYVIDPKNEATDYESDWLGRRKAMVTPDHGGVRTEYEYDAADNLLTTIEDVGGAGRRTENQYDVANRLERTTVDPTGLNQVTSYGYYDNGWLQTSTVDPGGQNIATGYTYDAVGRQVSAVTTPGNMGTWTTYKTAGWVATVTNGVTVTTYDYDAVGNRTFMQVSGNSPVTYYFDDANRLGRNGDRLATSQVVDGKTVCTWRTPDGANRTLASTDANGNSTTFSYDKANRVKTVADAESGTTAYNYDIPGRTTTVTSPDTGTQTTVFDAAGQVSSTADSVHPATGYGYDEVGRLELVTSADGSTSTSAFDRLGRTVTETRAASGEPSMVTGYSYNDAARQVTTTFDSAGLNLTSSDVYDAVGRISANTVNGAPGGNIVTSYHYNLATRTNTVTVGDKTTTTTYNIDGSTASVSDGVTTTSYTYYTNGAVYTQTVSGRSPIYYYYDGAGRLIRTEQAVDGQTVVNQRVLDDAGRLLRSVDGDGKITRYGYDRANRLVSMVNPLGEVTRYGYDANGRQTLVAQANGTRLTSKYDLAGQVVETAGGPEGKKAYQYDSMGRPTIVTDAYGRTKRTDYDGHGRKIRVVNEMSQAVAFNYDLAGRMTALTDPRGNATSWTYDGAGRQLSMTYPVVTGMPTNVEYYSYNDPSGLMSRKTTPNGVNIDYTYYGNGSVHTVAVPGQTVTYSLEAGGAVSGVNDGTVVMGFTYDALGRLKTASDSGAGKSLTYAYNLRSLRTSVAGTNSGDLPEAISYIYDDAGRLAGVQKGVEAPSAFTYDAGGRRVELKLPNGVATNYSFDNADRLLGLATKKSDGTPVAGFGYILDKVGNRLVVEEKDYTLSYKYDQAYRVTGESRIRKADGRLVYEDELGYDAAGNRTSRKNWSFGTTEPAADTPYGIWPLDRVNAKDFTPPTAAFTADANTSVLYHLDDSDAEIVDDSGNSNNGTVYAAVDMPAEGKFNTALRLAPDTEIYGRIDASAVALGTGDWTFEAWTSLEGVGTAYPKGERTVLGQAGSDGMPVLILSLAEGYPALMVRYSVGGVQDEVRIVGQTKAELDAWQHLAAERKGSLLALFLDGKCVATGELPAGASVLSAEKLMVGCGDPNGAGIRAGGNFAGTIDEVRISSIARYSGLTTPEITDNGPDGELFGGVTLTESGRFGPALSFDGSGYVKLTDDGAFLKQGGAKRTIELWVKADSTSGTQMLYEEGSSTNGFAVRISAGYLQFRVASGGTPKTVSAAYTSTGWHKVQAVYDGSTTNGTMTLYVDDTSVATDANVGFNSVGSSTDGAALGGTVGTDVFGGSSTVGSFAGLIDAVRVLNDVADTTAMVVEETTYHYNERNQLYLEETAGGTHKHYYYNRNGENTDPDNNNIAVLEHSASETVVSTVKKEYDAFGRMTKYTKIDGTGTTTEEHTYRGAGWERASTTVAGITTKYLYDGDNVIGDLLGGSFTRQYVTPFLDENLSMTVQGTTPATYYYHRDGIGSVRGLTDGGQNVVNKYSFTAFGEPYAPGTSVTAGLEQRYTFQGREASGNAGAPMYYRNRMYSANLGRFGRRDPVLGGDYLFNSYGFPGENAVMGLDPMGEDIRDDPAYGIAAAIKLLEIMRARDEAGLEVLPRSFQETVALGEGAGKKMVETPIKWTTTPGDAPPAGWTILPYKGVNYIIPDEDARKVHNWVYTGTRVEDVNTGVTFVFHGAFQELDLQEAELQKALMHAVNMKVFETQMEEYNAQPGVKAEKAMTAVNVFVMEETGIDDWCKAADNKDASGLEKTWLVFKGAGKFVMCALPAGKAGTGVRASELKGLSKVQKLSRLTKEAENGKLLTVKPSWGGVRDYKASKKLGLTASGARESINPMTAMEHINYRHAATSGFKESKFASGTGVREIKTLVEDAVANGKWSRQKGGGYSIVCDMKRTIGTDRDGGLATTLQVYLSDKLEVLTAFPIGVK